MRFIYVKDKKTKEKLMNEGYVLLKDTPGRWVFINKPGEMEFVKNKNIVYSDILTF